VRFALLVHLLRLRRVWFPTLRKCRLPGQIPALIFIINSENERS